MSSQDFPVGTRVMVVARNDSIDQAMSSDPERSHHQRKGIVIDKCSCKERPRTCYHNYNPGYVLIRYDDHYPEYPDAPWEVSINLEHNPMYQIIHDEPIIEEVNIP